MAWPMCLMAWPAFIIQIGDFPEALNYMYKQLDVAQRIGDQRRVANAYNNLANIYFESGDYDRAIETLHHNLQIAGETDYERIVCLSLLNLAETYLLAGDGERALENGLHGLRVSQETGFELFEVYALRSHRQILREAGQSVAGNSLSGTGFGVVREAGIKSNRTIDFVESWARHIVTCSSSIALWSIYSRLSPSRSQSMPGVSCSKAICSSLKSINSRGIWPQHCIISRSTTPPESLSSTRRPISG